MSISEEKIAELEKRIADNNIDIEFCNEDIQKLKGVLKKSVSESEIDEYIDAKATCSNQGINDLNKVSEQDTVTTLESKYPQLTQLQSIIEDRENAKWDNELLTEELEKEKANLSAPSEDTKVETKTEPPSQEGHLYPVTLVSNWTNKLKQYNKQMDDFLADIDKLSVNVDLTWLCKKVEAFCRKINYAIAMVRYEIIKGLSAIYKQANVFSNMIDPIANFNPTDIFACLGWVKNVIKFFLGPYLIVIQFISDFMTYTPPLVAEAGKLVGKAATVPIHLINTIHFVADGKDGEQKELAQAMSEYCNIQAEPITLGDVMGGSPQKPTMESSNFTAKQKELYEKQKETAMAKVLQAWQNLVDYVDGLASNGYRKLWVSRPTEIVNFSSSATFYARKPLYVTSDAISDINSVYVGLAKSEVFGKDALKKDVSNRKVNTRRHKFYILTDTEMFINSLKNNDLYGKVCTYYATLYSKESSRNTADNLAYFVQWVTYVNLYSELFPRIPEFINKVGEAVKNYETMSTKVEELEEV